MGAIHSNKQDATTSDKCCDGLSLPRFGAGTFAERQNVLVGDIGASRERLASEGCPSNSGCPSAIEETTRLRLKKSLSSQELEYINNILDDACVSNDDFLLVPPNCLFPPRPSNPLKIAWQGPSKRPRAIYVNNEELYSSEILRVNSLHPSSAGEGFSSLDPDSKMGSPQMTEEASLETPPSRILRPATNSRPPEPVSHATATSSSIQLNAARDLFVQTMKDLFIPIADSRGETSPSEVDELMNSRPSSSSGAVNASGNQTKRSPFMPSFADLDNPGSRLRREDGESLSRRGSSSSIPNISLMPRKSTRGSTRDPWGSDCAYFTG
jgi:hypothetical protein